MIIVESNSRCHPPNYVWDRLSPDDLVVTVKWPTPNTDWLAGRHISHRKGNHFPFLCYKYDPEIGQQGGKWDFIERKDIIHTDWESWDELYRSFVNRPVKHPDPSSGTCAVYSVVEHFKPEKVGLIGFDYVLDNNTDWLHDAQAELASIESVVDIVDLRPEARVIDRTGVNYA